MIGYQYASDDKHANSQSRCNLSPFLIHNQKSFRFTQFTVFPPVKEEHAISYISFWIFNRLNIVKFPTGILRGTWRQISHFFAR